MILMFLGGQDLSNRKTLSENKGERAHSLLVKKGYMIRQT